MFLIMDNDVTPSPLSALMAACRADDFLLVGGVIIIVLSSIFILSSSLLDQSAFGTFPGENGKIAYTSQGEYTNRQIYVMHSDGSEPTNISNNPAFSDQEPDWSPNGTKIAFESVREDPNNIEIYVMNSDGSSQRRLTNNPAYDRLPSWSPDGEKVAFLSYRDGNYEIYVMNAADGGGVTRLTNNVHVGDTAVSWSPDGEKIAFTSYRDGNAEIYAMNAADGGGVTRLTNNPADDLQPDWSPDGNRIAFISNRDGPLHNNNFEIYVMNAADGGGVTRLTSHHYPDYDPSWSPDGTKIAFNGHRPFASGIYVMNPDGTEQTYLRSPYTDFYPDWGPATDTEPPEEEDTTPPVITIPEDITEEATSPDGATVSFEVTAEDDVDGPTDVDCDHNSGETFPIGETVVTCSAEDLSGNHAEESFTITVQDTTAPDVEITDAVDRRRNMEITDGGTTPIPYIRITFEATDAVGIEKTECSLDGQPFTPCTSPVVYDRLSRSTHEFIVRSTDAAGNTGEDEFSWTVGNPSAAAPGRQ
jgi:Tol biopolymer transport system component